MVNDKEFCRKNRIGKQDLKSREIVVPLKAFEKKLKSFVKEKQKAGFNIIVEGHLPCEIPLPADLVVLLHCEPRLLEKRLLGRKYSQVKVLDNVFCEITGYCRQRVLENYPKARLLELDSGSEARQASAKIIAFISAHESVGLKILKESFVRKVF